MSQPVVSTVRIDSPFHPFRAGDWVRLIKPDDPEIPVGTEGIVTHPGPSYPYVSWSGFPDHYAETNRSVMAGEGARGWPTNPACLVLVP